MSCHGKQKRRMMSYPCHECNLLFDNKPEYNEHLKSDKHKEGMSIEISFKLPLILILILITALFNAQRTDCDVCKKDFGTVKELQFHKLKYHKDDNNSFVCDEPTPVDYQEDNNNSSSNIISQPPTKLYKISENDVVEIYDNSEIIGTFNNIQSVPKNEPDNTNNNGGLVVSEYIVNEIPTSGPETIILQNHEAFTVIPLNNDNNEAHVIENEHILPNEVETKTKTKKEQRKSLAESLAAAIADNDDYTNEEHMSEDDIKLKDNVGKLLDMLVDKTTLKKFGWPTATEETVS